MVELNEVCQVEGEMRANSRARGTELLALGERGLWGCGGQVREGQSR